MAEAFMTWGQIPYSDNNPSMEDMKTYLSSSAAQNICKPLKTETPEK